ncbi:unnamed protein product [Caenorhabditis bovis]|uniref:Methyltransferase domain-containing protein n=1 Tax=Caenorhabditis bovis TaxID=2654633 RepID=A0A8S1F2J7_9PELO|nr:unnamed protein product [Caenorhabditis bovis]
MLKEVIEYSKTQVEKRKEALEKNNFNRIDFADLYGALASEVYCARKVRVGTIGDGGKWICDPWSIPKNCVIFSLGLNNQVQFDEDIQEIIQNRCKIYGFDNEEQNDLTKLKFSKINGATKVALISETTNRALNKFTISDLAKDANVKSIEILKIDIESAEHSVLIPFLEKYTICQILIEIHGMAHRHKTLLLKIGKLKYRLFSYEVNGFDIKACEYSFIHESCIEKYNAIRISYFLE